MRHWRMTPRAISTSRRWSPRRGPFPGLVGLDLAKEVSCRQSYRWDEMRWAWPEGYRRREGEGLRVVAIDYGAKRNILRCLASRRLRRHGAARHRHRRRGAGARPRGGVPVERPRRSGGDRRIRGADDPGRAGRGLPLFGICLGHQMLALALGARTVKMNHGHHGANHPVKDLETGKVEITSMNHGFTVDSQTLPEGVIETHVSLFDGSNCGIRLDERPVFSVQYHPEASPGPQDSYYLFERFVEAMAARARPARGNDVAHGLMLR